MSVSAKILQVMADVGMLSKDKQLKDGARYEYLSEEKVTAELHAACVKHKLVVCPISMVILETREDTLQSGKLLHVARIMVAYRLTDPEGTEQDYLDVCALGEGSDMGDKVLNKCMTAAYKYAMRQTFMISTGDDPDHKASEPVAAAPQQQYTPPAAARPASTAARPAPTAATQGGTATLRDLFTAAAAAGLTEPDPTPDRPDREKFTGEFYGVMENASLPKQWSKLTPEQYAQAITAVREHTARHTDDFADMSDPFADQ